MHIKATSYLTEKERKTLKDLFWSVCFSSTLALLFGFTSSWLVVRLIGLVLGVAAVSHGILTLAYYAGLAMGRKEVTLNEYTR